MMGIPRLTSREDIRRSRFASYFPRLFAYAHSLTDDDGRAREIVVEAFARAFAPGKDVSDDEFPVVLFGLARELCREQRSTKRLLDGLSVRERDVIALVFDAQLARPQIASLLGLSDEDLVATLLRGLRKLRASLAPVQVPSFFQKQA
jgi:DNA-directed RNA polymerase specialized sigma24 family protein